MRTRKRYSVNVSMSTTAMPPLAEGPWLAARGAALGKTVEHDDLGTEWLASGFTRSDTTCGDGS